MFRGSVPRRAIRTFNSQSADQRSSGGSPTKRIVLCERSEPTSWRAVSAAATRQIAPRVYVLPFVARWRQISHIAVLCARRRRHRRGGCRRRRLLFRTPTVTGAGYVCSRTHAAKRRCRGLFRQKASSKGFLYWAHTERIRGSKLGRKIPSQLIVSSRAAAPPRCRAPRVRKPKNANFSHGAVLPPAADLFSYIALIMTGPLPAATTPLLWVVFGFRFMVHPFARPPGV